MSQYERIISSSSHIRLKIPVMSSTAAGIFFLAIPKFFFLKNCISLYIT
jgi:hypothetical protein